jgi:hypothetical protein
MAKAKSSPLTLISVIRPPSPASRRQATKAPHKKQVFPRGSKKKKEKESASAEINTLLFLLSSLHPLPSRSSPALK